MAQFDDSIKELSTGAQLHHQIDLHLILRHDVSHDVTLKSFQFFHILGTMLSGEMDLKDPHHTLSVPIPNISPESWRGHLKSFIELDDIGMVLQLLRVQREA